MTINNFAQLKKELAEGVNLTMIDTNMKGHKYLGTTRAIVKKQTSAIMLEGGSWLGLGSTGEKASDFKFYGNNEFSIMSGYKDEYITYRLTN